MNGHYDVSSPVPELLQAADGRKDRLALSGLLTLWRQRARTRHQLAGLDDRQLRDIGVDRAMAQCEAAKPFWRP